MAIYLKQFNTHSEYEQYINGSGAILPNVSICKTEGDVHYNPFVETRVVAKFNVTDASNPTQLCYNSAVSQFSAIEIDGVAQPSVVSAYTFSTTGEYTVKYTLKDPTSISGYTFYGCSSLTSINIPDNVTSIGGNAFTYCNSLTSIDIPSGVTSIGSNTFESCSSLTSINIPSSVTYIGSGAFGGCSGLTSIDIPSGVTSIGSNTFSRCSGLTSIDIPDGVTRIGSYAFYKCRNLTNITVRATTAPTVTNTTFQSVKTDGTLTVPSGSSGYDIWMQNADYYLGLYGWTKVEQ